jgi:NTE family protein
MTSSSPKVNLALQGGGSHGAFTWGVLDVLLEDGRIEIEGISGTSAGAMNAIALAHGFAQASERTRQEMRESARASLEQFWEGVVRLGALTSSMTQAQRLPLDILFGGFTSSCGDESPSQLLSHAMTSFWSKAVSPYQSNPLEINPLKDLLEKLIDFDRIATYGDLKIFVVATEVNTGKAEIFAGKRLTAKAVMASACLPTIFHAVEIEGKHYWDGGYSGNPAIHPLIYRCDSSDIVLVQINPIKHDKLPKTSGEILDRINEITFNSALVAEMRAIDFVKRLLAEGTLDPTRYKDVRMHRIDGGETLEDFHASTKTATDSKLIYALRDLGKDSANIWLKNKFSSLGVASSINISRDYLDDLRVPSR